LIARNRHCEERSDEAIQCAVIEWFVFDRGALDCFASLAMTVRPTC
jgi:hypothetical protein